MKRLLGVRLVIRQSIWTETNYHHDCTCYRNMVILYKITYYDSGVLMVIEGVSWPTGVYVVLLSDNYNDYKSCWWCYCPTFIVSMIFYNLLLSSFTHITHSMIPTTTHTSPSCLESWGQLILNIAGSLAWARSCDL